MRKVEKGQCMTCDRHFPPAVSSCVIAEDNVENCPHYLENKAVEVSAVLSVYETTEEEVVEEVVEEEEEEVYVF